MSEAEYTKCNEGWQCARRAEPFAHWCFETGEIPVIDRNNAIAIGRKFVEEFARLMNDFFHPTKIEIENSNTNLINIGYGGPCSVLIASKIPKKNTTVVHPSISEINSGHYPDMMSISSEVFINEQPNGIKSNFIINLEVYSDIWFVNQGHSKKQSSLAKSNGERLRIAIKKFIAENDFANVYISDISKNYFHYIDSIDDFGPIIDVDSDVKKEDLFLKHKNFNVKKLDLGGYELKEIPDNIGKYNKLKILRLNHNQLDSFPLSICQISSLRELRLSHNNISKLPMLVTKLENLEKIYLNSNNFSTFPEPLLHMKKLKTIVLDNNSIEKIPNTINMMNSLEELALENNNLTNIPEALFDCLNITELVLINNNIISISESILKLSNLEWLALERNPIKELPKSIFEMKIPDFTY